MLLINSNSPLKFLFKKPQMRLRKSQRMEFTFMVYLWTELDGIEILCKSLTSSQVKCTIRCHAFTSSQKKISNVAKMTMLVHAIRQLLELVSYLLQDNQLISLWLSTSHLMSIQRFGSKELLHLFACLTTDQLNDRDLFLNFSLK